MYRQAFWLTCILLCSSMNAWAQKRENQLKYIDRFKDICIREMERTGIPASIKLAQGLVESGAGTSNLAVKSNNHFGIKCGNDWNGESYYVEDDDFDSLGNKRLSCFRVYNNPDLSFVGHSEFLRDPRKVKRYGFLFSFDPKDYKSWAYGLKQAGYATHPNYPDMLIRVIEDLQLYQYDRMTSSDLGGTVATAGNTIMINDCQALMTRQGETLANVAARFGISLKKLSEYNENRYGHDEPLARDTRIFLERKRRYYRGKQDSHFVKEGETAFSISQLYGIRLYHLYKKNRMPEGSEPILGERLSLRGMVDRDRAPRVKGRDEGKPVPVKPSKPGQPAVDETPGFPRALSGGLLDFEISPDTTYKTQTPATPDVPPATKPAPDTAKTKPALPGKTTVPQKDTLKTSTKPETPGTTGPAPGKPTPNNNTTKPDSTATGNNTGKPVTPATGNNTGNGASDPASGTSPVYHTVATGDTLYNISKRYGTTVDELRRLNNLADSGIKLGQQLRVK